MRKTILIVAALATTSVGALAAPSLASAYGAAFVTPGGAAYCGTDESSGDYLVCWTPNDGFTVVLYWAGRSSKRYERGNRHYYARAARTLRFGQTWRGPNGFRLCEHSQRSHVHEPSGPRMVARTLRRLPDVLSRARRGRIEPTAGQD